MSDNAGLPGPHPGGARYDPEALTAGYPQPGLPPGYSAPGYSPPGYPPPQYPQPGYPPPGYPLGGSPPPAPPPPRGRAGLWAAAVVVVAAVIGGGYVAVHRGWIHLPGDSAQTDSESTPDTAVAAPVPTGTPPIPGSPAAPAPGGPPPAGGTLSEQQFQDGLAQNGIALPFEQSRQYAQQFCTTARGGDVLDAAIATMFTLVSYTHEQVDAFNRLAAQTYCPEITNIPPMAK